MCHNAGACGVNKVVGAYMKDFNMDRFSTPGLYLLMPDGETITLTHEAITATTQMLLDDPTAIPEHVRSATEYKPCDICPERDRAVICHAIMPTLPFFDDVDRYMSYDKVTAIYREVDSDFVVVSETTMQDALQFITILSLIHHCEVGQQYTAYFEGINPLMPLPEIGRAVFLNIYFASRGDLTLAAQIADEMSANILHTARCQTERLRLISRGDAFLNAFVSTELITHFVMNELHDHLEGVQKE